MDHNHSKTEVRIYSGWVAEPVNDSFWRATNKVAPAGSPSPFAQKIAAKKEAAGAATVKLEI